jgi:hypothetical protein
MPITFNKIDDEFGSYWVAEVASPYGGIFTVDPFTPLECSVCHQTKGGKNGFGVRFSIKNTHKVLHVGTAGEAENLLREIKSNLTPRFWRQQQEDEY